MRRLSRPDKHWKFAPGDVDEREHWSAYLEAYDRALAATSTGHAPGRWSRPTASGTPAAPCSSC